MKDVFLLEEKIAKKGQRMERLRKMKKILIGKVEREEKKKADELVK